MGAILDQLQRLPAEAFAEKVRLRDRQAELQRLLAEIGIPGGQETKKRWSGAAADKRFAEETTEMISPIESGSSGGV